MASSHCGRVLAVISVFVILLDNGTAKLVKNYAICEKLDPDPYFDATAMIGKPWRIQHAWNSPPKKCHEVKFRAPTEMLITQVYKNSQPYLDRQPNWTSPRLVVTISKVPTDLLVLFTDDSVGKGNFDGIRYTRRADVTPKTKRLRKFKLRMLSERKYALFVNCDDQVAWLLSRTPQILPQNELEEVSKKLGGRDLGKPVCGKKSRKSKANKDRVDGLKV